MFIKSLVLKGIPVSYCMVCVFVREENQLPKALGLSDANPYNNLLIAIAR